MAQTAPNSLCQKSIQHRSDRMQNSPTRTRLEISMAVGKQPERRHWTVFRRPVSLPPTWLS